MSAQYHHVHGECTDLVFDVQFVVFPGLKRFVDSSVTLHRVVHQNGASTGAKPPEESKTDTYIVVSPCYWTPVLATSTYTPVGDFQSSRWRQSVVAAWFGSDSHSTELLVVLLHAHSGLLVFGPAAAL